MYGSTEDNHEWNLEDTLDNVWQRFGIKSGVCSISQVCEKASDIKKSRNIGC